MNSFKRIIIIYNPNSTGDSEANAKKCESELKNKLLKTEVIVIATKYKAHAEEIVAEYSFDEKTLIISSSGDGGYNEVINGVLDNGGKAAMAVLPSGNANDHHNDAGSDDLIKNIVNANIIKIDVIKLSATINGNEWTRYAHSYAGFGLTPKVGKVLTDERPNIITEKWYVVRHALKFRSISLLVEGKKRRYNNLIFATVSRMSKVVKLNDSASLIDGKMEMYQSGYVSVWGVVKLLVKAGTAGMTATRQVTKFQLETIRPTLVQLDGEVYTIDGNSGVKIECVKAALRTIR